MVTSTYNQPQISVKDQIELLKSDGLIFQDEERARHLLENVSMFRMKNYLNPFRQRGNRRFRKNTTFEDVYKIYMFDSELRNLVYSELEKIEISIRTQLSLIMGDVAGIYWFEDSSNFRNTNRHTLLLNKLADELRRSDDEAIVAFKRRYSNPFPPSWITFEVSSFGTLSMMYRWINAGKARRKVARFYGLSDTVMESWLHSIVYVRNICAHHSRLWNRKLSINALVPRRTNMPFIEIPNDTKRVYYVFSIILYFLKTVNADNLFVTRFDALLAKYPKINVCAMGFPSNWKDNELWK
ncbi:MAG: Abi family protein [Bacteroidales bacterium]|jgi:abortive infection bacteriophage resistance protein|nr:Abi family protein [Bacteroidales bacterium]